MKGRSHTISSLMHTSNEFYCRNGLYFQFIDKEVHKSFQTDLSRSSRIYFKFVKQKNFGSWDNS